MNTWAQLTILVVSGSLCLAGCGATSTEIKNGAEHEDTTTTVFASAAIGTDVHHLGRPYDSNFQPLTGPNGGTLFPKSKQPHESITNVMNHQRFVVESYRQFAANAQAWGIVSGGMRTAATRRYAAYRAFQITKVVELDDTTRMRRPPRGALYYVWRIHYGRLYEVVLSGDKKTFHAGARAAFLGFGGNVDYLTSTYRLTKHSHGRGLKPTGGAIFATTEAEVRRRYSDDPRISKSVPIFVEYKRIPNVRVPKQRRFKWESAGARGGKTRLEPSDLVGTWDVSMTAKYSTCSNMKRGETRKVQWRIEHKTGSYSARVIGAKAPDTKVYKGWTESPLLYFRAENSVGIELKLTGPNELRGRRVVANPGGV